MKIVAYGASMKNNFGGPSLLYGAYEIWKDKLTDLEIVFIDYSKSSEASAATRHIPVRFVIMSMSKKRKWLLALMMYKLFRIKPSGTEGELLEHFLSADAVVDLWGIAFSDKLGMPKFWLRSVYRRLYHVTSRLLNKKFIKYTSSFGPIQKSQTRRFAKIFLNKWSDVIICREQQSRKVLEEIGINKSMLVCPDSALAMKPEPVKNHPHSDLFEEDPVVGISVSHQIMKQWKSTDAYTDIIGDFIQKCIHEFGCNILLIPNETGFDNDDICVAELIYSQCASKERVHILSVKEFTAPQLKYVISRCEIILASRYHTIVASLSTAVPTLVIGWHYKYEELLEHFHQKEYLLDCQNCSREECNIKLQQLWINRNQIHTELTKQYETVRKQLDNGANELVNLVNRKK